MSKLISQGGFGCVYYPGITCNGKEEKNKKYLSKLQKKSFNSENEIIIGNIVKHIPNYEIFFIPVISSCDIELRNISNNSILSDCEVIHNVKKKHSVMKLPYIKNISFYRSLISNSFGKTGKKKTILSIVESFTHLLDAIGHLQEKSIVHFDLKGSNILYSIKSGYPLILDFGISIPINMLDDDNMQEYFYGYIPEYYVWCLDIHIINYLLYETRSSLTESDVKSISEEFVKSNKGLKIFSREFREKYRALCETYMLTLVGKNKKETIELLIKNYKTWDLYSLGIAYLRLFNYMFPKQFHKNTLIILFSQILLYNIHPDPSQRYSLEKTRSLFNNIFYKVDSIQEYTELIDNIDYSDGLNTNQLIEDNKELQKLFLTKNV